MLFWFLAFFVFFYTLQSHERTAKHRADKQLQAIKDLNKRGR